MLAFCSAIHYFLIFIFGAIIGSFINSLVYRLNSQEGPWPKRSYCPHCRQSLGLADLIPIFSFLALKGNCRYCGKKISWQYPLVEVVTAILFVFVFWRLSLGVGLISVLEFRCSDILLLLYLLLTAFLMVVIFISDLRYYIIPDVIIYPAIIVSGIWNIVYGIFSPDAGYHILNTFSAAIGASLFFLFIILLSRGKWMGWGDVKLAVWMGLLLGCPNILVALFLAFSAGALIGTGLIVCKKKSLKSEVPFGPFLIGGTFIALFWGEKIVNWYVYLLF